MKTFYFNTGVKFYDYPFLYGNQVNKNGIKHIPFDVEDDLPDDAELLFCCDSPHLPERWTDNVKVVSIYNTDLGSKYAYFKIRRN